MALDSTLLPQGTQPVRNILAAAFLPPGSGVNDTIPIGTTDAYFTVSQGGLITTYRGRVTANFQLQCPGYVIITLTERKGLIPATSQISFSINDIVAISFIPVAGNA